MKTNLTRVRVSALVIGSACVPALGQYTTPNVINVPGATSATLGGTTFTNQGLVGVGRISASALDSFGETFGSVSGLQITNWSGNGASGYSGTFNVLPDRGYNNNNAGGFFSNYAARIQTVNFAFTPYYGSSNIGGTDVASKMAAQNQVTLTSSISGQKFTYRDPNTGTLQNTTGLDPAASSQALWGGTMPYVRNYGSASPGQSNQTFNNINRLTLDSEALVLRQDGSGYIGDEYGANIYHFSSSKEIDGVIVPPMALQPHSPAGTLNYNSTATPANGRRNNQGFEGVAMSPDGTRLFAVMQSAARQDADAANNQNAKHTRVLVYDISGGATPTAPIEEYALTLPTYRLDGSGGAPDRTAAQSEIVALDNSRFLVLSRDGNGLGSSSSNPSMYKSVLMVDTRVGNATNFANDAAINAEAGRITSSSGVLSAGITALSSTEVVNILNANQLNKFNIELDTGVGQVSKLTLGEVEGMSVVSCNDPLAPNDFFLFVANDNDFLTSEGMIVGPGGTLIPYNGFNNTFAPYPANRVPAPVGSSTANENDTMFLVYRVTIVPAPGTAAVGGGLILGAMLRRRR